MQPQQFAHQQQHQQSQFPQQQQQQFQQSQQLAPAQNPYNMLRLAFPAMVSVISKKNMRTQHWLYFKIIEYRSADSNNKKYIFNNIYQWTYLVDTLIAYISQCQSSMYISKYDYFGYTKLCKNLINL